MSEPLLLKAAVLQANLRMLESQADILSDFNDMQALRRYRAEALDFIAVHAAAGRLPADPLAVIAGRLNRIARFFVAAGEETDRLLAWKKIWLKKIPGVSLPELHDAAKETAQAIQDLPASAAGLAAMLDDVDWQASGETADLHPELLVCAASLGVAEVPSQAERRQALRAYAEKTGELSRNVSNHLSKVNRRIEELIALHASHQAMVADGKVQLIQQNFRSAATILETIGSQRFTDIDYSKLEGGVQKQLALFDRFVGMAESIGKSLAKGRLKTVSRELSELRALSGHPASEFGQETSRLLKDADAQVASFLRGRTRKRLITAVVLVGVLAAVGFGINEERKATLAQAKEKAKAEREVAEAKAKAERDEAEAKAKAEREAVEVKTKLSSEIGAGQIGATLDLPLVGKMVIPFKFCPAGSFRMGSPSAEGGHFSHENQVSVTLTKGFWMAKTEVTQAQWQAVMNGNPSHFKGDNLPVENVSWNDAQGFIKEANGCGMIPEGWKMALPTEAQWEYACRAGETGPYSGGTLDEVGWYDGNSRLQIHPVATKMANAWSMHDMHGNVMEWCTDWYGDTLLGGINPTGASSGVSRVSRGGSWGVYAAYCRAANRYWYFPDYRDDYLGFRPALVPSD